MYRGVIAILAILTIGVFSVGTSHFAHWVDVFGGALGGIALGAALFGPKEL